MSNKQNLPAKQGEVFTPSEAANYLGISKSTLSKYRADGRGPVFLKIGRIVKYRLTDLVAYLDGCRIQPEVLGGGRNE